MLQTPRRQGRCQWAGGRCRSGSGKRASARGPQKSAKPKQATQKDGGGKEDAFHGGAKHGGAMTDGGETRKTLYLGSKGVTATSTRCRGARRGYVRLIAGSGGAPAANFVGGAAVAMAA